LGLTAAARLPNRSREVAMNNAWWSKPTYTGDYTGFTTICGLPSGTSLNSNAVASESDLDFYCDPCEKSFKLESQLAAHVNQHVSCSFAGCTFAGYVAQFHLICTLKMFYLSII
jgi:hypothetical protein